MKREEVRQKLNNLVLGEYNFNEFYSFAKKLMEDGPTAEEIKGFVDSVRDRAVTLNPDLPPSAKTIDIAGTGGDQIKTINVGSIASLVLAAGGLVVGKSATRAYTGNSGSKDLFDELGIPVSLTVADPKKTENLLEETSFAAYYYPSFSDKFENNKTFFGELKEKGLSFITPWHVAAWLYNPLKLNYRIYGMFTDEYFEAVADVLKDQGVEKGWVLHGVDGLDEVSSVGTTKVLEFSNLSPRHSRGGGNPVAEDRAFELEPEDFGIQKSKAEDITVSSKEEAIQIGKEVISGERKDQFRDLVAINAAAGFYIVGIEKDLKSATQSAIELLESGKVLEKVREIQEALKE